MSDTLELGRVTGRAPAVQVLRAGAGLVLGHGCPGRRLLRALPAVLRPRANRVSPPSRRALDSRAGVRDARLGRRVSRSCPLRRPHRGVRARQPDRPHEHDLRARRLPASRRQLMVTGQQTLVLIDIDSRRPTPVPDELRSAIRELRGERPRGVTGRTLEVVAARRRAGRRGGRRPARGRCSARRRARDRLGGDRLRRGRRASTRAGRRRGRRRSATTSADPLPGRPRRRAVGRRGDRAASSSNGSRPPSLRTR